MAKQKLFGDWSNRLQRRSRGSFIAAVLLVLAATIVRAGVGLVADNVLPFPTYFPAVFFATLLGGLEAGAFAAIISAVIAWWLFMPPYLDFFVRPTNDQLTNLVFFCFGCSLIIWGAERYRELMDRLQAEERLRKIAVEELSHRLKNKIATIQSIINYPLRDQPHIRNDISKRLKALSSTDDLIMKAQGQGVSLFDLLSAELGPYEISRVSLRGPNLFLPPKLALTMALLVHELATNAAKYGSLQTPQGSLSISWSVVEDRFNLEWQERGGPSTNCPTHRGFGSRLISAALDQFEGAAEMVFEPAGLVCRMSALLPAQAKTIP